MNGLDKDNLFRTPIVFRQQGQARFRGEPTKGPSAGQMVQLSIEQEKRGWCSHCNTVNGHSLRCERVVVSRALPETKPTYSLKVSLWIWSLIIFGLGVGLVLVLTTGGR